jgi:hypothetical protein
LSRLRDGDSVRAAVQYTCAFGASGFDLVVTLTGRVSAEEIDAARRAVAADPRLRPGMSMLWDFDGADATLLTAAGVRSLAADTPLLDKLPRAVAFVAPTPVAFGFSRMFTTLTRAEELVGHAVVCSSVAEAERWLQEHDGAEAPSGRG